MPTRTQAHNEGIRTSVGTWFFTAAAAVFMTGAHLDGWAHINVPELETFFSPWHMVLYLGYFSTVIVLFVWTGIRASEGVPWKKAIPPGYGLSAIGMGLFLIGGVTDMLWHTAFGIEENIEMFVSPPHLFIAAGSFLTISGGYREWARMNVNVSRKINAQIPMLLSLVYMLTVTNFMTHFFHVTALFPSQGVVLTGTGNLDQYYFAMMLSGAYILSLFFLGCFFLPLKRGSLPFGSATFVILLHMLAMSGMYARTDLLPASLVAGIATDVLLLILPPFNENRRSALFFSFVFPVMLFLLLFSTMFFTDAGLPFTYWVGTSVMGGFAGLLFGAMAWPAKTT